MTVSLGPRGDKWCVFISRPLLWILEIPTLSLPFLPVFMIEWCIFTFAYCRCIPHLCAPQKWVNVQGCWKRTVSSSCVPVLASADRASSWLFISHDALRRETLWCEDESWRLAGSTEFRCERGEVGDHVSQSPSLCGSEMKAVRKETAWRSYALPAGDRDAWGPTWAWVTAHLPDYWSVVWSSLQPDTSLTSVFVR